MPELGDSLVGRTGTGSLKPNPGPKKKKKSQEQTCNFSVVEVQTGGSPGAGWPVTLLYTW